MAFLEFYKKGQGSRGRLIAIVALFLLAGWGAYSLWVTLQGAAWADRTLLLVPKIRLEIDWALIVALIVTIGAWVGIVWLVNRPKIVDLLVETEGEMKKVSWPSRQEAWNSSVIVVITVIVMMGVLFFYDVVLNLILGRLFGA